MTDKKVLVGVGVIYAGCVGLTVLTKNSSVFEHVIAGSVCFLCFIVSSKTAYDHYNTAYNLLYNHLIKLLNK